MTKPSKFGIAKKREQDKSGEKFELLETGVSDAPVKDLKWTGQEFETKSDPMMDDGSGKPIILRTFEFNLPPDLPKHLIPSKKQLLDFHRSKIVAFLWKDELELIQDIKIIQSKNKRGFRIFATCQAKKGSIIPHYAEPQLLQNAIRNKPER